MLVEEKIVEILLKKGWKVSTAESCTGGMFSEVKDTEQLKRFFDSFINGYETQNYLEAVWYDRIPMFVNYRRMLLFTCMQDWLNTEPDIKNGFIKNILDPQKLW